MQRRAESRGKEREERRRSTSLSCRRRRNQENTNHSPDERIFSMSAALGEAFPPSWACCGWEFEREREREKERGGSARDKRALGRWKAAAAAARSTPVPPFSPFLALRRGSLGAWIATLTAPVLARRTAVSHSWWMRSGGTHQEVGSDRLHVGVIEVGERERKRGKLFEL